MAKTKTKAAQILREPTARMRRKIEDRDAALRAAGAHVRPRPTAPMMTIAGMAGSPPAAGPAIIGGWIEERAALPDALAQVDAGTPLRLGPLLARLATELEENCCVMDRLSVAVGALRPVDARETLGPVEETHLVPQLQTLVRRLVALNQLWSRLADQLDEAL